MRRRDVLLGGVAAAVLARAAQAQCVTDTVAVDACRGGVYVGGAPSLDLNFTGGTLDPRITFTRAAGPATYFDVAGVMQTAGTNVARFDYDPVTHAPKGLLIEEARTNIALQSKFGGAVWQIGSAVLTANSALSVNGATSAATLREDNTTGLHYALQPLTKASSSLTYAVSFAAKAGVGTRNLMGLFDDGGANGVQFFVTPSTGAIASALVPIGTGFSGTAVVATSLGNGWWRYAFTVTTNTATTLRLVNMMASGLVNSYAGDNVSTVLLDDFQCELAPFSTSIIPTTTAAATRAADVATMPVGPWFNAAAGTLVADALIPFLSGLTFTFVTIDDGVGTNRLALRTTSTVTNCFYLVASVTTATATIGAVAAGAAFKAGAAMLPGSFSGSVNGSAIVSASGAQPTGLTTVRLGSSNATNAQLNGWLSRVRYWPRALSDAELQAVTAPDPNPSLDLAMIGPTLDPRIAFTRAAGPATYFDAASVLQTAGFNYIRNNTMVGGIAGSPGTTPTNWVPQGTGLTQTLAFSTVDGMRVMDIRFAGTTGATFANVTFEGNNVIAAANAQTWMQSCYVALVGGSLTNVNTVTLAAGQYSSTPTFLSNRSTDITALLTNTMQRLSSMVVTNNASIAFIQPTILVSFASGVAVDFTLRVALPQMEFGGIMNAPIATSGVASGAPRFDYDPVTHAPRGLLIEEARTNIVTNSGDFTNASWTKSVCTLAAGIPGPNGATTGSGIISNAAATGYIAAPAFTPTSGTSYTMSVFAKAGSLSNVILLMPSTWWVDGFVRNANFNLTTGVVASTSGTGAVGAITLVGNGWYRISLTATPDAAVSAGLQFARATAVGDGTTIQHYAFGAQFETGAFPTSYIPTTGAAATRAADVATMPVGAWFNVAAGTLVADAMEPQAAPAASQQYQFQLDDGSDNNRVLVRNFFGGATLIGNSIVATATTANTASAGSLTPGTPYRVGLSYGAATIAVSFNGGVPQSASGALPASFSTLRLGNTVAVNASINGYMRRVRYWPRALSVSELQAVTT